MKIVPTRMQNFISNPKTADFVENTIIAVSAETILKMIGRPSFILMDKETEGKKKQFAAVKEFLYQAICLGFYFTIVGPIKKGCYRAVSKFLSRKPENAEMLHNYEALEGILKKAEKADNENVNPLQKIKNTFLGGKKTQAIKQITKDEAEIFDICEFNYETKSIKDPLNKILEKLEAHYKIFEQCHAEQQAGSKRKIEYLNKTLKNILENKGDDKKIMGMLEHILENVKARKFGKGVHEFGAIFGSVATLAILAPEISHFVIHPLMHLLGFEKPNNTQH